MKTIESPADRVPYERTAATSSADAVMRTIEPQTDHATIERADRLAPRGLRSFT